jgi:hypothetical protein
VISRREIILGGTAAAAVIWLARLSNSAMAQAASPGKFEIVKSDEEWHRELTSELRRAPSARDRASLDKPAQ